MTLTMPDFMPCLSILSMKRLKLRNWSMVCRSLVSTDYVSSQIYAVCLHAICFAQNV